MRTYTLGKDVNGVQLIVSSFINAQNARLSGRLASADDIYACPGSRCVPKTGCPAGSLASASFNAFNAHRSLHLNLTTASSRLLRRKYSNVVRVCRGPSDQRQTYQQLGVNVDADLALPAESIPFMDDCPGL